MGKTSGYIAWALQILSSVILLQTLYFKFTAAPESVYIFNKLGVEPWGRILSGIIELVAGVLLLTRSYAWLGAFIATGVMAGAIVSHITILGIDIMGDKGELFGLALAVFISGIVILFIRRKDIIFIKNII
jgi:uncharacterized membrane protein YphA (DoxX/SURF4 family)